MNILVIGNGFDLAHGLPTKYGDFLEWVKVIRELIKIKKMNGSCFGFDNVNSYIAEFADKLIESRIENSHSFKQIWKELLDDNIWIDYFLQCDVYQEENWVDFEREMSNVIQSIHIDMKKGNFNVRNVIYEFTDTFFNEKYIDNYDIIKSQIYRRAYKKISKKEKKKGKKWSEKRKRKYLIEYLQRHYMEYLPDEITYKQLILKLEEDLKKLNHALEIYLTEYIAEIDKVKKSVDIENINPDFVLSFNYSDTYERVYESGKEIEYDYIHGKANIENTMESNNMVLGIDEYLTKKRRNTETEFIIFKKYYQRIYKETGCKYKEWIYKIRESGKSIEEKLRAEYSIQIPFLKFPNDARHNLYIYGHSLDITDRDILSELILNDNVYTTIFYYNRADLGSKIANLVKVIGQDELIRRTGGSTKTIEFKLQQDMVEI